MTYPNPLKVVARQFTDNIVLAASGFKRFGKINFGARMALFHYNDSVVVWSAIPYCEETSKALELLTGKLSSDVSYLIIPDKEHTMAAKLFKAKFPSLKIIAMELVDLGPETPIDYAFTTKYAQKIIDKPLLEEIGIKDAVITDNFEFVYLPTHGNKELVTFDKNSKTVFEADLLFNLRDDQPLEQFSEATGFSANYYPHSGWSHLTRFMNPDSAVGNFLINRIANTTASADGLRAIYSWNFDKLVMCHGNVITANAKAEFKKVFGKVLE